MWGQTRPLADTRAFERQNQDQNCLGGPAERSQREEEEEEEEEVVAVAPNRWRQTARQPSVEATESDNSLLSRFAPA